MPSNDKELAQVDELIESIQNFCGRENRADAKMMFPRGLMRTAENYRACLPDSLDREKKRATAPTALCSSTCFGGLQDRVADRGIGADVGDPDC
jgi:hypothetical protein